MELTRLEGLRFCDRGTRVYSREWVTLFPQNRRYESLRVSLYVISPNIYNPWWLTGLKIPTNSLCAWVCYRHTDEGEFQKHEGLRPNGEIIL